MSDVIIAVDVSPSEAHLALVYRDGTQPKWKRIRFPEVDEASDANLTRAVEIASANASPVVDLIASVDPAPTLVVMSKLFLFDMKTDPSGPRRAALWWEIARRVRALQTEGSKNYALAEVAPMTAQRVVTGRTTPGRAGFADTERGLRALYPDLSSRVTDGYRWYVVGEALTAATALGWSSRVTEAPPQRGALSALRGRVNSFPMGVPKTPEEWIELNKGHKDVYRPTTPKEKAS